MRAVRIAVSLSSHSTAIRPSHTVRVSLALNFIGILHIREYTMKGIEHRQIETNNGHKLSSTFYLPDGETIGAVIIVPAMGVTQKYYASFASWLKCRVIWLLLLIILEPGCLNLAS